ncbi:MAG: diadenylate cyclase CdaA [Bacilli bacterium]|nr:diadenylate cyclase CdaA [Bacilli bacterium]
MANIINIITKIIDIGVVWFMFYTILKYAKTNVKLILILKGVLLILVLKILSGLLNLNTVAILLEYVIEWGFLAIIIIFQPEIRSVLEDLGRSNLLGRHKVLTVDERERIVYEISNAIDYFKKNKIGCLLVIERDYSLGEYMEAATKLYADISSELLVSLFFPNNPLHDGAVIIEGNTVSCAGSILPTSINPAISKRLGTRHRAALGIAEVSDAIAIVVSEETGRISLAVNKELNYNITIDELKVLLLEELKPKKEIFYEADEEVEVEEGGMSDEKDSQIL